MHFRSRFELGGLRTSFLLHHCILYFLLFESVICIVRNTPWSQDKIVRKWASVISIRLSLFALIFVSTVYFLRLAVGVLLDIILTLWVNFCLQRSQKQTTPSCIGPIPVQNIWDIRTKDRIFTQDNQTCIGPILDDRLKEKFLKPWKDILYFHLRVCLPVRL